MKELQDVGLNIEDQGHPADYVRVNVQMHDDGSFEIIQCALIDSIIEDVGILCQGPAAVQKPLHAFKNCSSFNKDFN